jgi:hypothetical protein
MTSTAFKAVPTPEGDPDYGVAWHYGDPHREQRALLNGHAAIDLFPLGSNHGVRPRSVDVVTQPDNRAPGKFIARHFNHGTNFESTLSRGT